MNDNIITTPVVGEVEQSFLDYSLSVITDRAIPAVEDGLKPVMRRILWEMQEDGITSAKQYVKCATPVGNTMAKYHPHGDSSIYGALVHASQPWTMRYPLIDFHGNNGSRDGDGPAAYRYTECRLSHISEATLEHIKKDTVDWIPNYSETGKEPVYLTGRFPNLMCNGTTGIAVAMACSFAPHNLNEIMDAAILALSNPSAKDDEILAPISGPDFPTGGTIINKDELRGAYLTGKGRVRIRGDYHIETKAGKDTLVFDSIPYKISKETLIADIDALCEEKKIEGIVEIRDESNKKGVRFVIELAKGINGDVIANKLYRLTELETTYSINQVTLVEKTPKLLTFRQIIDYYNKHQETVYLRRLNYEANKLADRIHILQGLTRAAEDIDRIIYQIKMAPHAPAAKLSLKQMGFSDAQAQAILDMKLAKLAHTEKIAIENELQEKEKEHKALVFLINDSAARKSSLIDEYKEFKSKFGDVRKTAITQMNISDEEKEIAEIVPENCVVVITEAGNIKRIPAISYRTQKRNGKGIKNQDEVVHDVIKTNTIDNLMVFSTFGKVYKLAVNDIPAGTNATRGTSIETLVAMGVGEKFVTLASVARSAEQNQFVWFITKNGIIKKTGLSEYTGMKRKTGVIATTLKEGDALAKVFIAPDSQIMIFTKNGMALRFDGKNVSISSRTAIGVKAINLNEGDSVVDALYLSGEKSVMIFAENGMAKRVPVTDFVIQNRAGKGLICHKAGSVVAACPVNDDNMILVVGDTSTICVSAADVTEGSRSAQGVMVIKGNNIIGVARI